jgi:hypothetical protein
MDEQKCTKCGTTKPLIEFYFEDATQRYRRDCKECSKLRVSSWNSKNKEKRRITERRWYHLDANRSKNATLKAQHSFTIKEYNLLFEKQKNKCAICGTSHSGSRRSKFFCVDHCHKTGKIRGLLCQNCNRGLGMYNDDIVRLTAAIEYLKKHTEPI